MKRIKELLKAMLAMGREPQSFLGAWWIVFLLRLTPSPFKRRMALAMLSLSPHYFYRDHSEEYGDLSFRDFLEAEFERNRSTREMICKQILLPHLESHHQILDIGCGPGFLAKALSPHVRRVYACDISTGVLECAKILDFAPNIIFFEAGASGFARIEDGSLDLACSFAVIQHLRESAIRNLFQMARQKLRLGGRCLFQVQLENGKGRSEKKWSDDNSMKGRLKWKYGLNFFPRSEDFFRNLSMENKLNLVKIQRLSDLLTSPFDDIFHQHLIVLAKP